jgi:hypothetical protein
MNRILISLEKDIKKKERQIKLDQHLKKNLTEESDHKDKQYRHKIQNLELQLQIYKQELEQVS